MHATYMRATREDSSAARMLCVGRNGDAHAEKKRSFAKVEKGKESKESKNGERKLGECNVLPNVHLYTTKTRTSLATEMYSSPLGHRRM
jgi:hypothetical protein